LKFGGWAGPTGKASLLRSLECVGGIEEIFLAARKVPDAVFSDVRVEVANGLYNPLVAVFVLGAAIDPARRTLCIDEIYLMTANEMDGAVEILQQRRDEAAQRVTPTPTLAAVNIVWEELDPGLKIARVHGNSVADRQLLNGVDRVQPVEAFDELSVRAHEW
jgi:hypothetical protein